MKFPSSGMLRSFDWQLSTFLDNLSVRSSSGKQSSWTAIFALNGINQLVFLMELQFVFCEVVIGLSRVHGAGLTGESHCGSPGSILASLFDICCGQSGTGTGSSLRNSIFTCHYLSARGTHPSLF
jgi:hypothetical protein